MTGSFWNSRISSTRSFLTWYLLPRYWQRLPTDRGRAFAVGATHSVGKPVASLLACTLETGRTHQIRVHLAHLGYPIAGDDKYGDFSLNKALAKRGLKRMFLHAWRMVIHHPVTGKQMIFEAPLPRDLSDFMTQLDTKHAETV